MRCLDCPADLVRRPGQGKQRLRCQPCARRAMRAAVRKCSKCSGPALPRLSHCAACKRQVADHVRTCRCGVVFETRHPLKKYCSRACAPPRDYSKRRSTTLRGYGARHQQRRAELLPSAIGTACELCGDIMYGFDKLDADHVVPISQGGRDGPLRIVHSGCNRRRQALERANVTLSIAS